MASIMAVEAGTKYLSGHSDLLLGLVSANAAWFPRLHKTVDALAVQPGPEDVYLALRGLRTMELRLREAERQALALAHWLKDRAEVRSVIHPALPDYPGHEIWKRDFTGSSGLFSIVLQPVPRPGGRGNARRARIVRHGLFLGRLRKALSIPFDCTKHRTATRWAPGGPTLRFSVGLEDIEDLKEDLDRGFARLRAGSQRAKSDLPKAATKRDLGLDFALQFQDASPRARTQRCVAPSRSTENP